MAQAKEGHTEAADVVGDYDAICRVLQLCTEGEAKGDVAKLREAFHADARMFGSISGERYDVPIEELFALAESEPADTGSYRSRVLVEGFAQLGDVALGLPVGAQVHHPADRVVVIHHTCSPGVALSRLSHGSPPIEGGAR